MRLNFSYFEQWQKFDDGSFMSADAHINHPARLVYTKMIAEISESVLDVGCGYCVDYARFKEVGVNYSGIDVTPKFITVAKTKFHVPPSSLYIGSVLSLPFADASFDSVYTNSMLEHLPPETWKCAVSEIFRVARKQVILVFFIELNKNETVYMKQAAWGIFWAHKYGENEVTSYLVRLGAKAVHVLPSIRGKVEYTWYPAETIVEAVK